MKISIESFVHDPHTTSSSEDAFRQDFLVILNINYNWHDKSKKICLRIRSRSILDTSGCYDQIQYGLYYNDFTYVKG